MLHAPYLLGATLAVVAIAVIVLSRVASRFGADDPTVWEKQIREFEKADRESSPPSGVVVFTGSSSIRYWKSLQADMAPLPVLNRGFGGSQIHQVTHYADRIIFPYGPRAVVFYAGENDIAGATKRKSPQEVLEAYRTFCHTVHERLPGVPIWYIAIKPPKRQSESWPTMQEANRLVREFCATDNRLHFIDIVPAMLDAEGKPRPELYRWPGSHLSHQGYVTWTAVVKPVLEEALQAH